VLKSAAKSALSILVKKLPWGRRTLLDSLLDHFGRRAMLGSLLDDVGRYEDFQALAARFGIESVSVKGSNGVICGSINDIELLGSYAKRGAWALKTVTLFEQFFKTKGGGTFLDIGANIGFVLIPIARNPAVQCYGFEPEPRNFSYLKQNIATNCRHANVTVTQLALFDRKDTLEFELSPINYGDHRIRTTNANGAFMEATWATISVAADRLDSVVKLEDLGLPLAVKIDAEGAEPNIFGGGRKVLAAADLVSLEFWPYMMRRIGGDVEAELCFLGTNFREGSIAEGDTDTAPQWQSIEGVLDELQRHWTDRETEMRYFDIVVRK
jgi:FkbM family methyltransferase